MAWAFGSETLQIKYRTLSLCCKQYNKLQECSSFRNNKRSCLAHWRISPVCRLLQCASYSVTGNRSESQSCLFGAYQHCTAPLQKPLSSLSLGKLTKLLRIQPSGRSYLPPQARELARPEICVGTRLYLLWITDGMKTSACLRVGTQVAQMFIGGMGEQCLSVWLSRVMVWGAQVARKPPSTGKVHPVVRLLLLLSRKRMASTTFSTSGGRWRPKAKMEEASLVLPAPTNPQAQASSRPAGMVPAWTPGVWTPA